MSKWILVSSSWKNSPTTPGVVTITDYKFATLTRGTLAGSLEMTLTETITSGYVQDVYVVNKTHSDKVVHAFDFPKVLERAAPFPPTKDREKYHFAVFYQCPQSLIDLVPLHVTGTASVYNHDGKLLGAMDYEHVIGQKE